MEDIISGTSAFRLYRTPPHILALYEGLPVSRDHATRIKLVRDPFVKDILGSPLYVLARSRNEHSGAKYIKRQLINNDLPNGSVLDLEGFGQVASPALTLVTMARQVSQTHLAMAIYEMCGDFTVYEQASTLSSDSLSCLHVPLEHSQWRQVHDSDGKPTQLWQRPPLISIDELNGYLESCGNLRGASQVKAALKLVAGITRSPFEVQASMLLHAPRLLGGYGLAIETNKKISLTKAARKLAKRDACYADIYIESPDGSRAVIVECQGAMVHAGKSAAISDASRTTALETMGYDVILLTFNHILYPENLDTVVKLICKKLGIKMAAKTPRMTEAESNLRRELFIDWLTLGIAPRAPRKKWGK